MSGKHDAAPSSDAIQRVRQECDCSELRAIALLKLNDNNPLQAIEFYDSSRTIWQEIKPKHPMDHDSLEDESNGVSKPGECIPDEKFPLKNGSEEDSSSPTPKSRLPPTPPDDDDPVPKSPYSGPHAHSNTDPDPPPSDTNQIAPETDDPLHDPTTDEFVGPSEEPGSVLEENCISERLADQELSDHESLSSELPEWDFVLPVIPAPPELKAGGADGSASFSLRELVGAMQHGATHDKIQGYLSYYGSKTVLKYINGSVEGFPAMFYAVATNDDRVIRVCIGYGGDVNAVHGDKSHPLLAFAILNSDSLQNETTLTVATLLSFGAQASVIPKAFYTPFCQDLPDDGFDEEEMDDIRDKNKQWCTPAARARLAKTLNLAQRYYLEKSIKTKKPSLRHKQVALRRNAEALLGIHYFLIGQTAAATSLMQKLLNYMLLPSKRPLVLVFAGPSGHGKTELARRLGHLLSLELEVVDCTIYSRESDLFGHRAPYTGSERGTPVNNFLARYNGKRGIVFLDEFEKTTADVHKSLLIPFDQGEYQDRRHLTTIDCSKMIFILASNALDPTIMEFCRQNKKAIFENDDSTELLRLMKILGKQLKNEFKDQFKPPLTGRITAFLPFLPFSKAEQAVVAHKYVMELAQKVRKAINMSTGPEEQLLGNVYLRVRRDASVCNILAREGYDEDLGARSLITAVKSVIEETLVESYLDVDEDIREDQGVTQYVVDIRNGEVEVTMVPEDIDLMDDSEGEGL